MPQKGHTKYLNLVRGGGGWERDSCLVSNGHHPEKGAGELGRALNAFSLPYPISRHHSSVSNMEEVPGF